MHLSLLFLDLTSENSTSFNLYVSINLLPCMAEILRIIAVDFGLWWLVVFLSSVIHYLNCIMSIHSISQLLLICINWWWQILILLAGVVPKWFTCNTTCTCDRNHRSYWTRHVGQRTWHIQIFYQESYALRTESGN